MKRGEEIVGSVTMKPNEKNAVRIFIVMYTSEIFYIILFVYVQMSNIIMCCFKDIYQMCK